MSVTEKICKECGKEVETVYENNRGCDECNLKKSIEMYMNCICPEMSYKSRKHKEVPCLGDECVAFEKTKSYAYCKKIDLDYVLPNLV